MAASGLIVCASYVVGLLLGAIAIAPWGIPLSSWIMGGAGLLATGLMPRFWRTGPRRPVWLMAAFLGGIAALYLGFRTPTPAANDVSLWLTKPNAPSQVEVWGLVDSSPRLTRSQKLQFQLNVFQIGGAASPESLHLPESVSGKTYVTVPLLWGTGIRPGQLISVKGRLYEPRPANNPGGYDFRAYLARQGIFSGLNGRWITFPEPEGRFRHQRSAIQRFVGNIQTGLWQVRRRIVRSHVLGLGVPEGPLMSAMLLGKGGVDVPYAVRDSFAAVGLAHALAASGFQVSLLVGLLLRFTQRVPASARLLLCSGVLLTYIGLTGLEPSVLRAGVMGFAVLLAMTIERRPRPLASLMVAAVILLLVNPLWIFDLGFQLSFVATLALLVMVPGLLHQLDWMPMGLATAIAVPLAASVWTMPLQLHTFGVLSPYSVVLNVLSAPVITLMSFGSAISGLVGLITPTIGGLVAWLFYVPTHSLIALTTWVAQLPGNNFATGAIALSQVLMLYGLYGLVWGLERVRRRWWIIAILCVGLIAIPARSATANRFQVTLLATSRHPVMVLQKQGEVGIIGNPDVRDAQFTVVPFLKKQGINGVDWAIANPSTSASNGWSELLKTLPIQQFYTLPEPPLPTPLRTALTRRGSQIMPLPLGEATPIGSTPVRLLTASPMALRFQLSDQIWLFVDGLQPDNITTLETAGTFSPAHVFWWSGNLDAATLSPLLDTISPQITIVSAAEVMPEMDDMLGDRAIDLLATRTDGAIQWTAESGFSRLLSADAE